MPAVLSGLKIYCGLLISYSFVEYLWTDQSIGKGEALLRLASLPLRSLPPSRSLR